MGAENLVCDNASVGIIARHHSDHILMIKRKKYPPGYALPAGHLDGYSYAEACFVEFEEETGLKIIGAPRPVGPLMKNAKTNNKCRRGGEYHFWQIFEVDWKGIIMPNPEETKWVGWKHINDIKRLALKTEVHLVKYELAKQAEEKSWTDGIHKSLDKEWAKCPGLEPVWCDILKELQII